MLYYPMEMFFNKLRLEQSARETSEKQSNLYVIVYAHLTFLPAETKIQKTGGFL
jgi:hypothetical protein